MDLFLGLLSLLLLAAPAVSLADPSTSCNYYASPTGGGDGASPSNPFLVSSFWKLAKPGMALCLLDGRYTGPSSMIVPPPGLAGSRGLPIVIKAWNDGQVLIDGQFSRRPVLLNFNDWTLVEGINACCSSASVVEISNSSHAAVRRVAGWDANDGNDKIFGVHYALHNLLEDVAGWGTARKIFESSFSGDFTTIRRAWGRWERSTVVGPKMVYSLAYNNYGMLVENSLGTWSGQGMPAFYTLRDYSGQPYTGPGGGTYTNFQVQQPYGIFSSDGLTDDKDLTFAGLLGSLAYTTPTDMLARQSLLFFTKVDGIQIQNSVGFYHPATQGGAYTFELHSLTEGKPRQDIDANISSFGGAGPLITDGWQSSNVLRGNAPTDSYRLGESLFDTTSGASLCMAYEDGILTSRPLWPWPMNDRIIQALIESGRAPIDVNETVQQIFGSIPSQCMADGGAPAAAVTLPVVGRLAGWKTDLDIANPSDRATEATLIFTPDGAAAPVERTVFLRARQSVTLADAIQAVFGFSEAAGSIRLVPGPEAAGPLEIHGRTYSVKTSGTVGAGVRGIADATPAAGQSRFVTGLSNTAAFRSTIGVSNPTSSAETFQIVVRDADGSVLGQTGPTVLAPAQHTQWSLAALFPKAVGQPLSAEFRPVGNSAAPLGYSMVVDNASGDPTYYSSSQPGSSLYLPAVARITGANGTLWKSDVTLTNPGDASASYRVSFLAHDAATATATPRDVFLGPHQTVQVIDVLPTWFGRTDTYGALAVTATGQGPVVAGRMYTESGGGGSVGQQIFAIRSTDVVTQGSLTGLREDEDFRSIVGFLNPQNAAVNVTAFLHNEDGALLATASLALPPASYVQESLSGLFPKVDFTTGQSYRATFDSGASGISAFASTVDNASQDLTFSLATPARAAPGPPAPPLISFTVAPACQTCKQSMQFTDTSTNGPITWSWDFGDGATSTQRNPPHTYAASGVYVVTLTVSNALAADSASQKVTINLGGQ
ncbi:MAG TPA: PKD domain-containing protein [Thermoanaerobaculia bacterium]|nr:PKD domain-containing protein [Thermoanaerobaculia bacterium]